MSKESLSAKVAVVGMTWPCGSTVGRPSPVGAEVVTPGSEFTRISGESATTTASSELGTMKELDSAFRFTILLYSPPFN